MAIKLAVSALMVLALGACDVGGGPGSGPEASVDQEATATATSMPGETEHADGGADPDGATATSAPPPPEPVAAVIEWTLVTQPMSAPVVSGSTVLYYALVADALRLIAVDATDGGVLWDEPATMSSSVTGIGAHVHVVDGAVVFLRPDETGSSRTATVQVREPSTGELLASSPAAEFGEVPTACADEEDAICTQIYRGPEPVTVRLSDEGDFIEAPEEGLDGWSGIGALGVARRTGQQIGRIVDGELLWSLDLGEVVSPTASTNSGWTFDAVLDDKLIVGTVGALDEWSGDSVSYSLTDYAAFALDPASGEVEWKVPGADLFCDVEVPDVAPEQEPLLACRWNSGTVTADEDGSTAEDVDVDLVRLDPESGEILWSLPLTGAHQPAKGWRVEVDPGPVGTVVLGSAEQAVLVDVATGRARPGDPGLVTWEPYDDIAEVRTLGETLNVARAGIADPRTADGSDTVTWPVAGHVGDTADVDGTELRIVAQSRALVAYRAP